MDAADWIVIGPAVSFSLSMLAAVIISVIAFAQGREISLWPPRIGSRITSDKEERDPKPVTVTSTPAVKDATQASVDPTQRRGTSGASGVVRAYRPHDVTLPTSERLFDREFTVEQAHEFYELIAQHYDERNSGQLRTTHRETVTRIRRIRSARKSMRMLDLGGGTGHQICTSFFDDEAIDLTYVDFSPAMLNQFQRNLAETNLMRNATVRLRDIQTALRELEPQSYDVILMSLVLSSTVNTPSFDEIGNLLAPGGSIIITDIDPAYTALHPFYAVRVNGQRYALRTRPIKPMDLVNSARLAGFHHSELVGIGYNNADYSFLASFERLQGN